MRRKVLVPLLVSGVFGDEMEVFPTDDEGSVHLCRDDGSRQDTATNRHVSGERALLVCRQISRQLSDIRRDQKVQVPIAKPTAAAH